MIYGGQKWLFYEIFKTRENREREWEGTNTDKIKIFSIWQKLFNK